MRCGKVIVMAVNYLKKKRMFDLVKQILADEVCPDNLNQCTYRFYRGTEWLKFCIGDYFIDLCHMGCHVSLDIDTYDDDFYCSSIDRLTFVYCNDKLELNYWRAGSGDYIRQDVKKFSRYVG